MNHDRARDLLLDLAYGELAPADAPGLEAHLAGCADCAAERARIAETRRAMAPLRDAPPCDGRRDAILAAARAAVAPPRPRRLRRSAMATIVATATVATIVAGVTLKLSARPPLDHRAADLGRVEDRPAAQQVVRGESVAQPAPHAPSAAADRDAFASVPAAPRVAQAPPAAKASRSRSATGAPAKAAPRPAARESAERREQTVAAADAPIQDRAVEAEVAANAPRDPARAAPGSTHAAAGAGGAPPPPAGAALRSQMAIDERASARGIAARVEKLLGAGALEESSRELTCGAVLLEQVSWTAGERVVKITLHAPDGTVVDGWYDREGRLRVGQARGGPELLTLSRHLDEAGRVLEEQRQGPHEQRQRSDGDDPLRWLPERDPGTTPGEGCQYRRE